MDNTPILRYPQGSSGSPSENPNNVQHSLNNGHGLGGSYPHHLNHGHNNHHHHPVSSYYNYPPHHPPPHHLHPQRYGPQPPSSDFHLIPGSSEGLLNPLGIPDENSGYAAAAAAVVSMDPYQQGGTFPHPFQSSLSLSQQSVRVGPMPASSKPGGRNYQTVSPSPTSRTLGQRHPGSGDGGLEDDRGIGIGNRFMIEIFNYFHFLINWSWCAWNFGIFSSYYNSLLSVIRLRRKVLKSCFVSFFIAEPPRHQEWCPMPLPRVQPIQSQFPQQIIQVITKSSPLQVE